MGGPCLALAAALAHACGPAASSPRPEGLRVDASLSEASAVSGSDASSSEDASVAPQLSWQEAMRAARYEEAWEAFSRLSVEEHHAAEVRLARAHAALTLGRASDALSDLEALENDLPRLKEFIGKTRAEAWWIAGSYERAAEVFAARPDARSRLRAAEAFERASHDDRARSVLDKLIAATRVSHRDKEAARLHRMQLAHKRGGDAAAAPDAEWLAAHATKAEAAASALSLLERLRPPRRVSKSPTTAERKDAIERCRLHASILWRARTRYEEAAKAYADCAELGGERALEHRFLSARAWLRAERDLEAREAFLGILARAPRTSWAEQAEYLLARHEALSGRWQAGAAALDAYARHWPKGKDRAEAERYRAVSRLMAKQWNAARREFEALTRTSSDPLTKGRWMNLAALAAAQDGDEPYALARWTELARSGGVSYAALLARAHLEERGLAVPSLVEATMSSPQKASALLVAPSDVRPLVDLLLRSGLVDEAEAMLGGAERVLLARCPTCAFPMPFARSVMSASESARVAPELIWAIMRQESAFDAEATSPAGAVGLMQLMPETARTTAEAHGLAHDDTKLTEPAHNVRVGALYVREVLDAMHAHVPLAIASYNAGPEAVRRWLDRTQGAPLDVFVEAIPFAETRGYVVRVLSNLARYGYLAKGEAGIPRLQLDLSSAISETKPH